MSLIEFTCSCGSNKVKTFWHQSDKNVSNVTKLNTPHLAHVCMKCGRNGTTPIQISLNIEDDNKYHIELLPTLWESHTTNRHSILGKSIPSVNNPHPPSEIVTMSREGFGQ